MFEKVNPSHPDKVADRIAGAIVDLAYNIDKNPKIAVEVLIGHGACDIIVESSVSLNFDDIHDIVDRIAGENIKASIGLYSQDYHLAKNQRGAIRCGDNGIFKGVPVSREEVQLSSLVKGLYYDYPYDGKFITNNGQLIACQSNASTEELKKILPNGSIINPLGDWTGGLYVDSGATNRKLGSDMAQSVTGGGLHGKDLSKADVSVNIYAWLEAQRTGRTIELCCAIGDETVDGKPYEEIVEIARDYITKIGGFEKFAEWGLV